MAECCLVADVCGGIASAWPKVRRSPTCRPLGVNTSDAPSTKCPYCTLNRSLQLRTRLGQASEDSAGNAALTLTAERREQSTGRCRARYLRSSLAMGQ